MGDLEAFQLQQRLRTLPEYRAIRHFQSLELSLGIFDQNYIELRLLILRITDGAVGMHVGQQSNRMLLDATLRELGRLLHNFIAAAKSLVDHTRRLYKKHYTNISIPEYQEELRNRFAEDPQIQFVQSLRSYVLHYQVPGLAFVTEILDMQGAVRHRIVLSTKDLVQESFDWSKLAREFIEDQKGHDIDLLQLVDEYRTKIENFYQWLGAKLQEIHRKDFLRISEVQEQILHRYSSRISPAISEHLALAERGLGTILDVLSPFLTPKEHTELSAFYSERQRWADAAVNAIEKYGGLPSDLKERVRRLANMGMGRTTPGV